MTDKKILRCAIYIRVSTAEQQMHGKSLQAQREYLFQYAQEHNMVVIEVFADEGKTARKEFKKRKAIHTLLRDVEHDEIDVILFWKMDRWFRNVSDFYKVQDILDRHNVTWIAAAEPNISMETREGRLNLNLVLSIGQNEVDTTSERIKFTVDNMISNGRLVFGDMNMPLGYKVGEVNGVPQMVKNEDEAPMVEEFFHFYATHQAKKKTVKHMHDTFGIDFSYTRLRTMLQSEFYIGKYRNNTQYCPAYLTLEEWYKIQEISKRNIKIQRSGRIYYFTGLIHCPMCGQRLNGTGCSSVINRKTGEKKSYCYYRCNKTHIDNLCSYRHRLSQKLVEKYLLDNLQDEFDSFCIRQDSLSEKKKKKTNTRAASKINAERDRLNILFQMGRIEWDYYTTEYERLDKELREINTDGVDLKKSYKHIDELLQSDFKALYNSLSAESRQAFWRGILKEIIINVDSTINHVDFY